MGLKQNLKYANPNIDWRVELKNFQNRSVESPYITLVESQFDPSKIVDYTPVNRIQKFIYRPQTLEQYIGQESAKELISINIKKINTLRPVHFLISGKKGHGKTTIAHIIKNLLKAEMIERVANQITDNDSIINIINQINTSKSDYVVLFIDEIHSLKPALCETLYPIMEDFQIAGKNIKKFILIGATTNLAKIEKNNSPLLDRFQAHIQLKDYTESDIKDFLVQYHEQLYKKMFITDENINLISRNCKLTPRLGINLLEDVLIEQDIQKIFKSRQIVKDGLTETDIKILSILSRNTKPIGFVTLARMVGLSELDYKNFYEPYLVNQEYIIPTNRGRVSTPKAVEFLERITVDYVQNKEHS